MKKYFIFLSVILITTLVVFADDARFTNALKNCSSYSVSGSVSTDGINATSNKKILGWQDGKCVYQEKVSFSGIDSCITCRFTKNQLNELASVMQAYNLVQSYSGEQVDTSSLDTVQNNPVVKAWNKYLQDSSVCTITATPPKMQ